VVLRKPGDGLNETRRAPMPGGGRRMPGAAAGGDRGAKVTVE
jgi:hypothetical protein